MRLRVVTLALAALALAAAPAAAQKRVQITPFFGYVLPQGELPETFAIDKTDGGSLDIRNGELEDRMQVYGGTIGVQVYRMLSVEGTFLTGTDKLAAFQRAETDVKILAYSAGVALELPKYGRVEPYVLGGVGIKSYDFDIPDTKAEKDVEYNFGGGVNIEVIERLALNLQARNLMSTYKSSLFEVPNEKQNDILLAAGLTFSFGMGHRTAAALRH